MTTVEQLYHVSTSGHEDSTFQMKYLFHLIKKKLLKVRQIEHYIKSIASENNHLNSMPFSKKNYLT
jgi:hypothetical protein